MITIFDKGNTPFIIRPCPFISINWNNFTNSDGKVGGKYDIVLTGTLLFHAGSPIFNFATRTNVQNATTWATQYYPGAVQDAKPSETNFPPTEPENLYGLASLLNKQIALKNLFAKECYKIEVASVKAGENEPVIQFYPNFISINFEEGLWVDRCNYTITLEAPFLLDKQENIIGVENHLPKATSNRLPLIPGNQPYPAIKVDDFLNRAGGFIEDFQESWSIEPEDGFGNTVDPWQQPASENTTKVYRITRNITAKGANIENYASHPSSNVPSAPIRKLGTKAHEQARRYVMNYIEGSGTTQNHYDDYPGVLNAFPPQFANFASGLINISSTDYLGYNHSRTENIDVAGGTYSVQDSWVLSSGNAHENYSLSLSSSEENPRNRVSIEGTIKGLTSIPGSGTVFGGNFLSSLNTAYENAINKYRQVTNSGQFGISAWTYKRAQNAAGGIDLNDTPLSVAVATNEFTGEINYTIEYDDRPRQLVSGVASSNVSVSDTYPGDVFAVIPVIGRPTGPVLQYIGGRTEHQRNLSIELVTLGSRFIKVPPAQLNNPNRVQLDARQQLLVKPSLVSPTREGILDIINAYSPGREPGIRKYYISPPQETWDPQQGRYTLNITWTYELNY
jgi:hypothetical protein